MQPNLPWRLFLDGAHSGAHNMSVDEAMLLCHARHLALPTLRFYGWKPSCLSLGRLQKQLPDGISPGSAASRDLDIVRRPTGGRAVWHAEEITYCAVVRAALLPPESRSVEGAYAWLSAGFLRGLESLGIGVKMARSGVRTNGANCFAASAGCDFLAEGKKLIGAAQCRKDDAILQHGSLLLSIDEAKWRRVAGGPMEGATSLEALGARQEPRVVIEALAQGFAAQTGATWQTGGLNEHETAMAQLLLGEKYRTPQWTWEAQVARESQGLIDDRLLEWNTGAAIGGQPQVETASQSGLSAL